MSARRWRYLRESNTCSVVRRVVSAARKNRIILILHFHFDLAVAAVVLLVSGGVADGVLVAQFLRDFIERLLQVLFAAHDDHTAAGLPREPAGDVPVAPIGGHQ